eukprot:5319639-Prymnesium_polylepis.2
MPSGVRAGGRSGAGVRRRSGGSPVCVRHPAYPRSAPQAQSRVRPKLPLQRARRRSGLHAEQLVHDALLAAVERLESCASVRGRLLLVLRRPKDTPMAAQQLEEGSPRVNPVAQLALVVHLRAVAVSEAPECIAAPLQPPPEQN